MLEDLFEANGWGDSWRDGRYDYVHHHSRIHEVPGIARGKGRVRFDGDKGRIFKLKAGDAVFYLPAPAINACRRTRTSWWSALILRRAPMTSARPSRIVRAR